MWRRNRTNFTVEELEQKIKELNFMFKAQDKVILDNDPRNPFTVNGHQTTFNGCYLYVVQSLSDLTQASNRLKMGDYYSYWTQAQDILIFLLEPLPKDQDLLRLAQLDITQALAQLSFTTALYG